MGAVARQPVGPFARGPATRTLRGGDNLFVYGTIYPKNHTLIQGR